MQIINAEQVGGVDAVRTCYEFADAEQTHGVDQYTGKADLWDLTGVDDLGEGNGHKGCQQQGNALHQTHVAGGQANIVDQPVAQMGEIEIKGNCSITPFLFATSMYPLSKSTSVKNLFTSLSNVAIID